MSDYVVDREKDELYARLEASEAARAKAEGERDSFAASWREANRKYNDLYWQAAATTGEVARLREALGEICHLARHEDSREESEIRDIARKALAPTDVVPHPPEAKPFDQALAEAHEALKLVGTGKLRHGELVTEGPRSYVADAVPPPQPTKEPSK